MDVTDTGPELRVRQARADDHAAVAAFTRDTWGQGSDYIPDVFQEWVETDGRDQRTFVLDAGDDIAGILQGVLLTPDEAWAQGMRINPAYRGAGLSPRLSRAVFEWAAEQGAVVCRNMVFSWNVAGLGQSRAVGFDPCTEFRYATPEPDSETSSEMSFSNDPAAAWAFWVCSQTRTVLQGLAMDSDESWALSELTREQLAAAADGGRLAVVQDGGTRGFTLRTRVTERETDDGTETRAVYGVAAWEDVGAARALYRWIARDAATLNADQVRVLIPEGVRWVSDTAKARVSVSEEPDFVMAADLTDPSLTPEA